MITLNNILNYIKSKDNSFSSYYIGRLNNKKDKSLGIYNLNRETDSYMSVGGDDCSKIKSKPFSILIHWNKSKTETEEVSFDLYEILKNVRDDIFDDYNINFIQLLCNEPIDVDVDVNGIYEYVIEGKIYYTISED